MDIHSNVLQYLLKKFKSRNLSENLLNHTGSRALFIFIFYVFMIGEAEVYSQEKTGANDNKTAEGNSGGSSAVWAVPAEQKVRPNDAVEASNLVWSGDKK